MSDRLGLRPMINVLIAEDNAAYRQSLHQELTESFPFMQITETADGADALHHALACHYDLIFMDIRLPQGNGLDLTRAIKAVFDDSIVCVITSYDQVNMGAIPIDSTNLTAGRMRFKRGP